MKVKKCSFTFFLATYGLLIIFWLLSLLGLYLSFLLKSVALLTICFFLVFLIPLPGIPLMISHIHKKMLKRLPQVRTELNKQGFEIEYEYISRDTVYFVNYSAGKMAVLFSMNPAKPQYIDPAMMQEIHTNEHRIFTGGTGCVACEFKLMGKTQRISTLMVTGGGTLSMKSREVLEAISKADQIGELLKTTQRNAAANKATV